MAVPDKLEAVKSVTETSSKYSINSAEEIERVAPNKDHFDSLMNSSQTLKTPSFEKIDTKTFSPEEIQSVETKPVFAEENVSTQKNGSATDQENRRQKQQLEEIEDVSVVSSKKSKTKSTSLMDEMSRVNKNVANISHLNPKNIQTQATETIARLENVKTRLAQSQGEIKPSYQTLLRNRLAHIDDNLKIALNKAGVEYTPQASANAGTNTNAVHKFIGYLSNSQHQLDNLNSAFEQFQASGSFTPANMLAIQMKMNYVQQQVELFTNLLNKALESTKTIMNVQV